MAVKKYSKEIIIQTLQNLAKQLGKDSLSKKEVSSHFPLSTINTYFGNLGNALEDAGLRRGDSREHFKDRGNVFSDNELFESLLMLEQELGHEPGHNEYAAGGDYSVRPFRTRFGKWKNVLAHYRKWKGERGNLVVAGSQSETPTADSSQIETGVDKQISTPQIKPKHTPKLYGKPIDFRGLRHAPINELGVVYLWGMVSKELGFSIESFQSGFPDCNGKYLYDSKKNLWAEARIEFEFMASNFVQHGHDINQCDFIVCWENDWPDCPITVIELKSEIIKLRQK